MTLKTHFLALEEKIESLALVFSGKITRISGVLIEAVGLKVSVGSICRIPIFDSTEFVFAEVIGFSKEITLLILFEEPLGILPESRIELVTSSFNIPVGRALMGRIVNGFCKPIDKKGNLNVNQTYPVVGNSINPIDRRRISKPLDTGVRAINSLLTVGIGQRIGIFAGSGVGKSMLLGMITRFTEAEVVVVGLIGERGREVKEFIEENIGEDYLNKTVIVAAPIDTSPLERTNGVLTAISIAEYYRDLGLNVLLIIDSLTRYAQALRQMYLLLGEPPSTKGYPPSVFAKLSQLVERCGNGCGTQGSITAFFTVLVEGDDMNDPVADHTRSVLDGHIVLSRKLAESSHYPAIDINASISRVMSAVVSKEHNEISMYFKRLYACYLQNEDLIKMGMYKMGADILLDEAMQLYPQLNIFLKQDYQESTAFQESLNTLFSIIKKTENA